MTSIETGEIVKGFDPMPVVQLPEDYIFSMPLFMARRAQEHGPIFKRATHGEEQELFGPWLVYMVGPEANRFVFQTNRDCFSHDRGWTPQLQYVMAKGLLNTDDPQHERD